MTTRTINRLADVELRLDEIRAVAGDDELAHSMQDQLLEDVLRHCATTSVIARKALEVFDIEFCRWCA